MGKVELGERLLSNLSNIGDFTEGNSDYSIIKQIIQQVNIA